MTGRPWMDSRLTWNAERRAEIARLWKEGMPASRIADHMGASSRGAIMGIIYRAGITREQPKAQPRHTRLQSERDKGIQARTRRVPPFAERASEPDFTPVPFKPREAKAAPPLHLSIYKLTKHTCKWPFGDRAPFTFCGHPSEPGLPFCEAHCGIAYHAPDPRRLGAPPC